MKKIMFTSYLKEAPLRSKTLLLLKSILIVFIFTGFSAHAGASITHSYYEGDGVDTSSFIGAYDLNKVDFRGYVPITSKNLNVKTSANVLEDVEMVANVLRRYRITDGDTRGKSCFPTAGVGFLFQRGQNGVCDGSHYIWRAGPNLILTEFDDGTATIEGTVIDSRGRIGLINVRLSGKANFGTTWEAACYLNGLSRNNQTYYQNFFGTITVQGQSFTVAREDRIHHFVLGDGAGFRPGTYGIGSWTAGSFGSCTEWFGNLEPIECETEANAGADQTTCETESVTLTATGGGTYRWSPGGQTTASITVRPETTTTYTVTVTKDGCEDTDTVTVSVVLVEIIGNRVWEDVNRDGILDFNEPGVNGVRVRLFECINGVKQNNPIQVTTTANLPNGRPGFYGFTICPGGDYAVEFQKPDGFEFTIRDSGDDFDRDSDVNPEGVTDCFPVILTELSADAGIVRIIDPVVCEATITATPNTAICAGETVTLTASGGGTYRWAPGGQTSASIQVSPTATTTYTVTTNLDGCEDSASVTITVENKVLIGNFLWEDLNRDGIQDAGEPGLNGFQVRLFECTSGGVMQPTAVQTTTTTNGPDGRPGFYSFEVCPGDTYALEFDKPADSRFTKKDEGSSNALDSDVNSQGMTGCLTITTDDVTIDAGVFKNDRVCNAEIIASPDTAICAGETVTLTASGGGTYRWSPGGQTTASITVSPTATTTYTVTISTDGCEDTESVTVMVEDSVTIGDFLWEDSNRNGIQDNGESGINGVQVRLFECENGVKQPTPTQTVTTTNGPDGRPGFYSFEVCPGDTYALEFDKPAGFNFTRKDEGTNERLDSDVNSQGMTGCFTVTTDDVTIDAGVVKEVGDCKAEINAAPATTICEGETVTLTASGGGTYRWSPGGQTTASIQVSPTATTTYTVTINVAGCTDDESVTITVEDKINIGNYVWEDLDRDGIQDANETGINGVQVSLLACMNGNPQTTPTQTTTTTNGPDGRPGFYTFEVCPGETYAVLFDKPTGTEFTKKDEGANDMVDSDVNSQGITVCFTVTGEDFTIDAGIVTGTTVICDAEITVSPDTSICAGEPVTLTASGGGTYLWSPGGQTTPSITVSPTATTTYSVTIRLNGCEDTESVAVMVEDRVKIGDFLWEDTNDNGIQDAGEPGINGVTVGLFECIGGVKQSTPSQIVTTANGPDGRPGFYSYEVCPGETYALQFDKPAGFEFARKDEGGNDMVDSDVNSQGMTECFTITGDNLTVDAGLVPTDNVTCEATINASPETTICEGETVTLTASGGGTYSWSPGGQTTASIQVSPTATTTYTVTTSADGCMDSESVTITVADKVTIGNFVWNDTNGNGIQDAGEPGVNGVTVSLLECVNGVKQPTPTQTTTTANGPDGRPGFYSFEVCPGETYSVLFDAPAGTEFTRKDEGTSDMLDSDVNSQGETDCFTVTNEDLSIAAGLVTTSTEPCEAAINVSPDTTICEGETVTLTASGGGTYSWSPGGQTTASIQVSPTATTTYTVTISADGCTDSESVTITVEDKVTIGDFVWNDTNGNGIQDNGETGVNGVPVRLFECVNGVKQPTPTQTTTTTNDPNGRPGFYSFEVCPGETYSLEFEAPTSTRFTRKDEGRDDSLDSDVNSQGMSECFTVTGEDLSIDAGLVPTTTIVCEAEITVSPETTICEGETVTLTATGGGTYSWSPGGQTTASIQVSPTATTTYTVTISAAGCTDSESVTITVENKVTIGNFVWNDTNGNGIQDAGEPGVNGVTVGLLECVNGVKQPTPTQTTTTTNGPDGRPGFYSFEVCPGETYSVLFDAPAGTEFTKKDEGTSDMVDSDVNSQGETDCFTVTGEDLSIAAGLVPTTTIVCEAEITVSPETTICEGETVTLTATGGGTYSWSPGGQTTASIQVSPTATTTYTVTISVDGCTDSESVTITVEDKVTIGDYVWNDTNRDGIQDDDETGINGLQIALFECVNGVKQRSPIMTASTINGPDGQPGFYSFEVCPGGEYSVQFDKKAGTEFTKKGEGTNNELDSNANPDGATDCFIVNGDDFSIDAGMVTILEDCDATIDVSPETTICAGETVTLTASGGVSYLWSPGGQTTASIDVNPTATTTYTVAIKVDGCKDEASVTITVEDNIKVGNFVWSDANGNGIQDAGEPGINGVKVSLFECIDSVQKNTPTQTVTTTNGPDGRPGFYSFAVCPVGEYAVQFDKPAGFEFTQTNTGTDDTVDSDVNSEGKTECFDITGENLNVDAGLSPINDCKLEVNIADQVEVCKDETVIVTANVTDTTKGCNGGCVYPVLDQKRCTASKGNHEVSINQKEGNSTNFKASEQRFETFVDGTAIYTATLSNGTDVLEIETRFSGYTTKAPAGSPKTNDCQTYDSSQWEYYTKMAGKITSQNHGTFTIKREGEAFQVGFGADVTRSGFGASGGFDVSGGDGFYTSGNINLALGKCVEQGIHYTWTTTDGNIIGSADGKSITVDKAGTYMVSVKNCKKCEATDTVTVVAGTSCTKESNSESTIRTVYPIPVASGGMLTVVFETESAENAAALSARVIASADTEEMVQVALYNMSGQMVGAPRGYTIVNGNATIFYDIAQLPTGTYILTTTGKNRSDRKTIIVK